MKEQNFLNKDMKKTMLKMYILHKLGNSKVNSYTLLKEIAERRSGGFFDSKKEIKNEIYNTINSLENSGYLKSTQKIENGRLKNYYALSAKGKKVLDSSRRMFKKHVSALAAILER